MTKSADNHQRFTPYQLGNHSILSDLNDAVIFFTGFSELRILLNAELHTNRRLTIDNKFRLIYIYIIYTYIDTI